MQAVPYISPPVPAVAEGAPPLDHGLAKGEHNTMTYTAEIRRVGGSLYKAARGSSNLFLPDTCFSNTVRPVWAEPACAHTHALSL